MGVDGISHALVAPPASTRDDAGAGACSEAADELPARQGVTAGVCADDGGLLRKLSNPLKTNFRNKTTLRYWPRQPQHLMAVFDTGGGGGEREYALLKR
jgi:hypothetical protein